MEESEEEPIVEMSSKRLPGIRLPDSHRPPTQKGAREGKWTRYSETAEVCLGNIHKALYQNQWPRAAELMHSYLQTLEDTTTSKMRVAPEVIWRIGTEILFHHPKSTFEDMNSFADRMKNLGLKNYLKVSLEHVFHLLCHGMTEEAYQILTLLESWRYGDRSESEEKLMHLVQAYRALLDYQKWTKERSALLEDELDHLSESAYMQEMKSRYRQATVALREIIQHPGVWDIFVQSYTDLLEFHGDRERASRLLHDYAYDSKYPTNPNAHVYLYSFLKRNDEPKESQIKVLMILHKLVPSHELMLELTALLQESESEERHQMGLQVLFSLLDFPVWKEHVTAWTYLAKQIKAATKGQHLEWLYNQWDSRKDWWPTFHFSEFLAKKDWKENEELALKKALVAGILLGKGCTYFAHVVHKGRKSQRKKCKSIRQFVESHCLAGLP